MTKQAHAVNKDEKPEMTLQDLILKYDDFEVHPCCKDEQTGHFVSCDENDPDIAVWTVYGHIDGEGNEWIADFDSMNNGKAYADLFSICLLEAHKQLMSEKYTIPGAA